MIDRSTVEPIEDFLEFGIEAFTTTRDTGSFGTATDEPVAEVMGRWEGLHRYVSGTASRFATARQVHGKRVLSHASCWSGWLRGDAADGHLTMHRGIGLAVTVADCVPVFIAHPSGAAALLHAGWRGTAAGILGFRFCDELGAVSYELIFVTQLGAVVLGRASRIARGPRLLLILSLAVPVATMAPALAWAWGRPLLDMTEMIWYHGLVNAFAHVGLGFAAFVWGRPPSHSQIQNMALRKSQER